MPEFDVTIFTVATNQYFDYLTLLVPQIIKYMCGNQRVQLVVATNRQQALEVEDSNLRVDYVPIENYQWPEITLLRYEVIEANSEVILGKNFMWVDTDMSIVRKIDLERLVKPPQSIFLARHPGYIFDFWRFFTLPLSEKRAAIAPWAKSLRHCQFVAGSWDETPGSRAFVKPPRRKKYVHGAVWMGRTTAVLDMCRTLAKHVKDDLENGLVAEWHDESHLNWYFDNFSETGLLPRHFSAWPKGWQFRPSQAYVISLDKLELDAKLAKPEGIN